MIEAKYNRREQSLAITGHAGYAPIGQDIVCAGVSALIYTLINSCECDIYEDTIHVYGAPQVYDAVICGLEMISKKFPKNLHIVPYRSEKPT